MDSLDGVFLSHDDADHIGSVAQVFTAFHQPPLYCSVLEPGRRFSSSSPLRALLRQPQPPVLHRLAAGEIIPLSGSAAFKAEARVLYPHPQVRDDRADDRAMVLMLHLGPWRVLWLSDAGWSTEKNLCASAADLRCDVLIRSQNEVDLSTTSEFLLRAAPRVILCGSDARAVHTAPSSALMHHAQSQNIPLLDTWNTGGIDLRFDIAALRISTHRDGQHLILRPRG